MKRGRTLFGVLYLSAIVASSIGAETADVTEYSDILAKSEIAPTTEGILKYLDDISPTPAMLNDVDALIRQLGAAKFRDRRSAQKKLEAMGALVENKVTAATKSADPEVRFGARQVLTNREKNNVASILYACLKMLQSLDAENAVPAILKAAPLYSEPYLKSCAEAVLVTLVKPGDTDTLVNALAGKDGPSRTTALNAYGTLLGPENSSKLYPYLKATDADMRLAAARAVANLGDRRAIEAFLELMADERAEIRSASVICMRQFTHCSLDVPGVRRQKRQRQGDYRVENMGDRRRQGHRTPVSAETVVRRELSQRPHPYRTWQRQRWCGRAQH